MLRPDTFALTALLALLTALGVLLILRGLANFGLVPSTGWW